MPRNSALSIRSHLMALIRGNGLGEDGRLPTERQLSESLGASRRAVRHAILSLEAEGLVWRKQGKGTFAGQPRDPLGVLAAEINGQTSVLEVMEARLCIEPELAALCARRALPDDISRMRHLAQRRFEAADPESIELWDGALHRLIAKCARNRPLLTSFALLDEMRSSETWVGVRSRARSPESLRVTTQQHHLIIDAIESGNPRAAREAMQNHLATRFDALMREIEAGARAPQAIADQNEEATT